MFMLRSPLALIVYSSSVSHITAIVKVPLPPRVKGGLPRARHDYFFSSISLTMVGSMASAQMP
jgi:hypothetical protein